MAFNQFPYTDFHEINADWILAKIKELEKRAAEMLTQIEANSENITENREDIQRLEGLITGITSELNTIQSDIDQRFLGVELDITSINNKLTTIDLELDQVARSIASLQGQIDANHSQIQDVETAVHRLSDNQPLMFDMPSGNGDYVSGVPSAETTTAIIQALSENKTCYAVLTGYSGQRKILPINKETNGYSVYSIYTSVEKAIMHKVEITSSNTFNYLSRILIKNPANNETNMILSTNSGGPNGPGVYWNSLNVLLKRIYPNASVNQALAFDGTNWVPMTIDEPFLVTFVGDTDANLTADKTYAEVLAAYNAGKHIKAVYKSSTGSITTLLGELCGVNIAPSGDGTLYFNAGYTSFVDITLDTSAFVLIQMNSNGTMHLTSTDI